MAYRDVDLCRYCGGLTRRRLASHLEQARQGELNILVLLVYPDLGNIAVIYMIVFIERGQRRITVNYAKRQQGRKMYQAQSSHLPLKSEYGRCDSGDFCQQYSCCFRPRLPSGLAPAGSADWLQDLGRGDWPWAAI